jgi:hypothetical protein
MPRQARPTPRCPCEDTALAVPRGRESASCGLDLHRGRAPAPRPYVSACVGESYGPVRRLPRANHRPLKASPRGSGGRQRATARQPQGEPADARGP